MDEVQSKARQGRVADAPSGHWVHAVLPRAAWPYAQLARWDRPIGWWLLLWPCWWAAALAPFGHDAASLPVTAHLPDPWHMFLFLVGAIAMRGAGCTYNDLVDQKIDCRVARTRSRPLPSGQVTRMRARAFLVAQALVGFVVLIQFNRTAIWVGIASLAVVAIYPFAKRFTDWPQLFLGLAFSWGAFMGWVAVHGTLGPAAALLYAGCVLWTVGYDTIYAHQDKEDDALLGVRSTARLFGDGTRRALVVLYGGMLLLLAASFASAQVPPIAYAGLVAAGVHMANQIRVLDIDDADQCLALFKSNTTVGWLILSGLMAGSVWTVLS